MKTQTDFEEELRINEHRFRAMQKALTTIANKLYELEGRIATLENTPQSARIAVKIDYQQKGKGKVPEEQTKL